ncbi:TPA: hypothetical protein N0F65_004728 [Lagenidium giganteum]|uniref:HotDog ACOT-type domain-containing protein n=1 Tax=Lagenidium giganteum TaxID=4803 RepID=A0AAV2Z0F8_9STRA|nr:TPA: hypothetical protein N0F65_004728 [Lagenidium giganteum]
MARIASEATRCAQADVIGDEALRGQYIGSGPILKKIDVLAADVGYLIARKAVVTVAFDTFKLLRPVFHGDFIRLEGRALSVSKSSIAIQVSVYRYDMGKREFQLTHNAIVTFVAVDKQFRPSGGLPELYDPDRPEACANLRELAARRRELGQRWRLAQDEIDKHSWITHDMIPATQPSDGGVRKKVNIADTVIETRNSFFLKHANLHRNVFGGVLLDWMDRAALHCARNFTKNMHMVTIGMNRVHFRLPIHLDNIVSIRARVCRVRTYTLEVEIAVYRVQQLTSQQLSHTGYFDVLNMEADKKSKRVIPFDVTADEADQDGMKALLRAHQRQLFEKEDAELTSVEPIPLSLSPRFSAPAAPSKL